MIRQYPAMFTAGYPALAANPQIDWVQLPWAGVEPYVPLMGDARIWTCAKGVYADPVAEHALGLMLAGFRVLHRYSGERSWSRQEGRNLIGARVTIVGGGGILGYLISGVLGSFVGGFLLSATGINLGIANKLLSQIVTSTIGAIVVVLLARLII